MSLGCVGVRFTLTSFDRCIGYPPLPENAPGISCGAHKGPSFAAPSLAVQAQLTFTRVFADYGCYTLLHADATTGALQVFLDSPTGDSEENGRRGTWINADPVLNAFVVNIGEMWEVWTNGVYKATLHRVIHKGRNFRVS
jgi:isopenicillin N synthase-like dioxygenase